MDDYIKGYLIYRKDIVKLNDSLFSELKRKKINSIFVVIKDYNGDWIESKEESIIDDWVRKYQLKKYGWICTQTEGYTGELASDGINPIFLKKQWSVVDAEKVDSIRNPIPGDFGYEQFACPNNNDHTKYVISKIKTVEKRYDGFLFDFIRFPLQNNYCHCKYCNSNALAKFDKKVSQLSNYEKYLLKKESINNLVNKYEKEVNSFKTYLLWPSFHFENLNRYQKPEEWQVKNLSPMLYYTLGEEKKLLRKFKKKYNSIGIIPLFLLKNATQLNNLKNVTENENFILTHYGIENEINGKRRSKVEIFTYDLYKDLVYKYHKLRFLVGK